MGPEHPEFTEIYKAARAGIQLHPQQAASEKAVRHSVAWLTALYLEHLEKMVAAGQASQATLDQRTHFMKTFREHPAISPKWVGTPLADMHMAVPQHELVGLRDAHAATSGKADNMIAAIRSMYRWAIEDRKLDGLSVNPAVGIGRIHKNQGGAVTWSVADLEKYRARWPSGTKQHLALSIFMFTALRISDAILLGRRNEEQVGAVTWLRVETQKKHSRDVYIPMLPPLRAAITAQTVVGPTYLLTQYGKPFASTNSFGNKFREWCIEAGLPDRSSHGIRKAAGKLLAQAGANQYEIMAIHGHSEARTSEVYTKDVERQRLAESAMSRLRNMDW